MVKNKLEKLFSASLQADKQFWGMKLQNNLLAHTVTPGDFIASHIDSKIGLILHLVECKQVTLDNEKGRLQFKRLKQMHDLLAFSDMRPAHHKAWFCIGFLNSHLKNSEVYLVPARALYEYIEHSAKESINRQEFLQNFIVDRMYVMPGSLLSLAVML